MERKTAVISKCGKYRYCLTRTWDEALPLIMFIMLNPSTADHEEDDPTIRRCKGFAKSWGYGGIVVCNLFAYRATNPKELLSVENPFGEGDIYDNLNLVTISLENRNCEHTVFAWGNTPIVRKLLKNFSGRILPMHISNVRYIELSKDGAPKHPLYLAGNNQLKSFPDLQEVFAYLK